ncbi:hypothetical protein A2125_00840 [Candidatus Woesebacteria bacterium GWB1_43_5]|uniref:Uncharacterized protein n=1 Tax=Candidatus Woesebacteria bacterium GWB1_43_5 TaxID=1802474 RepID=A0A1F7WRW8_9BACT|nr:MAG: hypothetical protein A2125_00840 [Candidatus Woesebacteria bacterium GWB1_43_5]
MEEGNEFQTVEASFTQSVSSRPELGWSGLLSKRALAIEFSGANCLRKEGSRKTTVLIFLFSIPGNNSGGNSIRPFAISPRVEM